MSRRHRRSLLPLLVGGMLAWAGHALAGTPVVTISAAGPQPPTSSVAWGGAVRFRNADSVAHTLRIAGEPSTGVQTIAPGATYGAVFDGMSGQLRYTIGGGQHRYHGTVTVGLSGQLTLEASTSSIVYGQKLALHGHTTLGHMEVTIQEEPLQEARALGKQATWTDVASVKPAADGSFDVSVSPTVGARYRAATAATQLRSSDVHVHVSPAISELISPHSAVIGGTIVAHARVLPASAATRAVLTRFVPAQKRWLPVASAPVSGGRVEIPWKSDRAGRLELRVELDAGGIGKGFVTATGAAVSVNVAWPPTTLSLQTIAAAGTARFAPQGLTAHPGRITVTMANLDAAPHNVAIRGEGVSVKGRVVGKNGTSRVTAQLAAGKYTLYSSADGPKSSLVGTLIVR